eukprot:g10460.t1
MRRELALRTAVNKLEKEIDTELEHRDRRRRYLDALRIRGQKEKWCWRCHSHQTFTGSYEMWGPRVEHVWKCAGCWQHLLAAPSAANGSSH